MLTLANQSGTDAAAAGAERRRGLRIRQCRPVKVYEPRASRYYPGRTADISATGLRLTLPLAVPIVPGSTISLHIGLDRAGDMLATRRHMIDAKVVWTSRDVSDPHGHLLVGLELLSTAAIQVDAA
jgi:hypothetical protein